VLAAAVVLMNTRDGYKVWTVQGHGLGVPPVGIESEPQRTYGMSITSGGAVSAATGAWGARASRARSTAIGVNERPVGGRTEHAPKADEARPPRCRASGWRLRVACTDGSSGAICPACGQQVGAFPDRAVGPGVWAIQEHGA
jgi:hypothetical protein